MKNWPLFKEAHFQWLAHSVAAPKDEAGPRVLWASCSTLCLHLPASTCLHGGPCSTEWWGLLYSSGARLWIISRKWRDSRLMWCFQKSSEVLSERKISLAKNPQAKGCRSFFFLEENCYLETCYKMCHAFRSTATMHLNSLGPNKVLPVVVLPFLGASAKGWPRH